MKSKITNIIFWIITLIAIVLTFNFYKKNKLSGLLQIPYLLWSLFASYLNLFIYLLNKIKGNMIYKNYISFL